MRKATKGAKWFVKKGTVYSLMKQWLTVHQVLCSSFSDSWCKLFNHYPLRHTSYWFWVISRRFRCTPTIPCHNPRARGLTGLCADRHSIYKTADLKSFVLFNSDEDVDVRFFYLYLSWTFCLISTTFSAEMSLSKYSERTSVAVSKSFWLA